MRTLRLSLVATVVLTLLGGIGGAVRAQDGAMAPALVTGTETCTGGEVETAQMEGYHLLHAARADLYRRLERNEEAATSYRRALELTTNASERRFLESRLAEVS